MTQFLFFLPFFFFPGRRSISTWEEDHKGRSVVPLYHRGKVLFSLQGAFHQHDIVGDPPNHLAEVVFVVFLHCKVILFSPSLVPTQYTLWKEVTMCSPNA